MPRPQFSFSGLDPLDIPPAFPFYQGKVRDVVDLENSLLLVTTDRISAFDLIWGQVPGKGELLTRLTLYWLAKAQSIIPTALIDSPSPHSMRMRKAQVIPVEMIVRGYLAGSAWRAYNNGQGLPGLELPSGLKENQKLDHPVLTPTTKASSGEHDHPISEEDILKGNLVSQEIWEQMSQASMDLFNLGTKELDQGGLILVDTKYEFGLVDGQLILIDEVHTPDSSRFWFSQDYEERMSEGQHPRQLDKEYFRKWLLNQGFDPQGSHTFEVPPEVLTDLQNRYEEAFEGITGKKMTYSGMNPQAETQILLSLMEKG